MNLNGCLMQLSILLGVGLTLFGVTAFMGPSVGNVFEDVILELDPPAQEVTITRAVLTIAPTVTSSPTLTAEPTFTPSATITASNTSTPTNTATHTATLTPSATATDTATPTNTATFTPTLTPTPAPLCLLRVNRILAVNVREESNASSPLVVQMPNNTNMEAYDQEIGFDLLVWYFIEVEVDGEFYEGWVRSDLVEQVTPCPPLD